MATKEEMDQAANLVNEAGRSVINGGFHVATAQAQVAQAIYVKVIAEQLHDLNRWMERIHTIVRQRS